jgi:hypothetical protein
MICCDKATLEQNFLELDLEHLLGEARAVPTKSIHINIHINRYDVVTYHKLCPNHFLRNVMEIR